MPNNVDIQPHPLKTQNIWNIDVPVNEVFYGQVGSIEGVFVRLESISEDGPIRGITCLNDPPRFWPDTTLVSVRYDYPVRIDSMVVTRLDIPEIPYEDEIVDSFDRKVA
jgi:hypothetical protein